MTLGFSIIIPTYQRRAIVLRSVAALDRQIHRDFEVIVVVDGSMDGTAEAVRAMSASFPLTVLEQRNQGGAAARNAGAAVATRDALLFLDDDMEAHPRLVSEHEGSLRGGADVVLGHMPLHPSSPRNVLSDGVRMWTDYRLERLTAPAAAIPLDDLLTGQMSIRRGAFDRVGGFDVRFTREGLFGGEDIDFGYRVIKAGCRVTFNAAAISHQYYDVDPGAYLRRARETGRAAQELIFKHPERAGELGRRQRVAHPRDWMLAALAAMPLAATRGLEAFVVGLVRGGRRAHSTRRAFFALRKMEEMRGVRSARRRRGAGQVVALAWHAIADLSDDRVLHDYGVPPGQFAEQLDALIEDGYRFVSLQAVLGALDGKRVLPPRALLVTFDDAYEDLLTAAVPMLAERGIPAVAFAVSDVLGGTNEWDGPLGARSLRILDPEGLRAVANRGITIGSHGATHRPLTSIPPPELDAELQGSAATLEALGLPRPTAFSYPHGEVNDAVAAAVRDAGYAAAFTVRPGVVRPGGDRHALPRIEVLAETTRVLRLKIATAAWPDPWQRRVLGLLRLAGLTPSLNLRIAQELSTGRQ